MSGARRPKELRRERGHLAVMRDGEDPKRIGLLVVALRQACGDRGRSPGLLPQHDRTRRLAHAGEEPRQEGAKLVLGRSIGKRRRPGFAVDLLDVEGDLADPMRAIEVEQRIGVREALAPEHGDHVERNPLRPQQRDRPHHPRMCARARTGSTCRVMQEGRTV